MIHIRRVSASCISSNSPDHTARYGGLNRCCVFSRASSTALARSRPRTLNFTAIRRFACFAVDHRGAGLLKLAVGVDGTILADGTHQVAQPQPRRVAERIGGVGQAAADRGRGLAGPGRRRGEPRSLGLDHLVVAHVHGNVEDRRFAAPPPCRPANRHVESSSRPRSSAVTAWPPKALPTTLFTSATCTPHRWHFSGSRRNSKCDCPRTLNTPTSSSPGTVLHDVLGLHGRGPGAC